MDVLAKALELLSKYPLCDHCMGRQFALLGYNMENNVRGSALKVSLTLQATDLAKESTPLGVKQLKILATNGFSREAQETLKHLKKRVPKASGNTCFLCNDKFKLLDCLTEKSLAAMRGYEFTTYLVGIELPVEVEEREDEFKAAFNLGYSESIKHEFGRLFGKALGARAGKETDYLKPELVVVINPFQEKVRIQVNPLFIAGRYRKLVRDIPQSKWFCSNCRGKGCEKCGGTGKLYPESVEELSSKPLLEAAKGEKTAFHASGREDIDARMLGSGRPFVIEISEPKKRSFDLKEIEAKINAGAAGKVQVSRLRFANKDTVRRLKRGEGSEKVYRLLVEFENEVSEEDLNMLEEKLSNASIKQQTPLRVVHRRANLVRERYIYKLKVKKVSLKRALMEIYCQGGLYVKELVSGDEGRTVPNVSDLLGNRAKTLKLDVLKVIMND
ncbi:MAG TPA: tRNA pseudouridine(54/55) synthase Pus10 [Candidatus Limnocylindrales bacterium]|nr:tRNA pseudouridine(54/55) synthase Pus10 [Candidatus Limnocylindrales bacterium]